MKLGTIRIPCCDLHQAEAFYSGPLGWKKLFGSPEAGYVGFELTPVVVLLEPEEAGGFEAGRYLGFSFEVPDILQFYHDATAKGVTFSGKPEPQP